MEREGFIYILSNYSNEVLYIGVTSNLKRRLSEHKKHTKEGFTDKYNTTKVLYVERTPRIIDAIEREKVLKKWSRTKKLQLIKKQNPTFKDLFYEIMN